MDEVKALSPKKAALSDTVDAKINCCGPFIHLHIILFNSACYHEKINYYTSYPTY